MELNREQIIKALEHWTKNFDGKVTDFVTLGQALALIKELIEENERLRVVADMSDTTLTDALRIVNEFCDIRIKRSNADTVRKMQGLLENRIKNKLSYHGWYIKETVIPAVVEEILKETKI